MISIPIPGYKELRLHHALFDFNGTLAVDGRLIDNLGSLLNELSEHLFVHVITGDGFGTAKEELAGVNCMISILPAENQASEKQNYLHQLSAEETVVVGNGRNDRLALKDAGLGILVLGDEGTASEALLAADIILPSIIQVFEVLHNPRRLIGTLRE